ncbi:MAG: hypothetical protein LBT26_09965 [Clostridiales Family XIII bacterium]|jgi:hypothetical protein|nr:hypothetical protein [Clostridiales Family XIII bacterium]
MPGLTPEQYLAQKGDILTRCLRLTEGFFGNLDDAEGLQELLDKRMDVIQEFQALESSVSDAFRDACPEDAFLALEDLLRQILDLDQKVSLNLRESQNQTLESMKSNTQVHRLTAYNAQASGSGRFIDQKK